MSLPPCPALNFHLRTVSQYALRYHPDKVAEDQREDSEAKFKQVKAAYEILSDEEKRHMYDTHGAAAFDPSSGMGDAALNMEDILAQMFGMGGLSGTGDGPKRPRRGPDEERSYQVTLEELYKGKTVKFAAQKQVNCPTCSGTGGKSGAKAKSCDKCKGNGVIHAIGQIGLGLMRQETVQCDHCNGRGKYYKEKDRCRKCKGSRTIKETKALEIYIPRGSINGERIILGGEADQHPDQIPGDIIFTIVEEPHEKFTRIGHDLSAELDITLSEALYGFSRVVLTHLDGRGVHVSRPRGEILKPDQALKVSGEGMPLKKGDEKGDLYLIVKIEFPEDNWLKSEKEWEALRKLLPPPRPPIVADEVDEVEYDDDADIKDVSLRLPSPFLSHANGPCRWVPIKVTPGTETNGRMKMTKKKAAPNALHNSLEKTVTS